MRQGSRFRVLLALVAALALSLGTLAGVYAGNGELPPAGGGEVTIGGNTNDNGQSNGQGQDAGQGQGSGADQGNEADAGQGSGSGVVTGLLSPPPPRCDASQSGDGAGDDETSCASGDATTGDSTVGDTNGANSGSQSGSNSSGQSGNQTDGDQANTPGNTNNQTVDADVTDIGGDDNDVDNSGSINGNTGTIDQSEDEDVIEGDDNEVGGAALLFQLLALLLNLLGDILGGPTPAEISSACLAVVGRTVDGGVEDLIEQGILDPGDTFEDAIDTCSANGVELDATQGGIIIFLIVNP